MFLSGDQKALEVRNKLLEQLKCSISTLTTNSFSSTGDINLKIHQEIKVMGAHMALLLFLIPTEKN